ncbi:MAG: HD domain-containing protein [Nitrospirae bacterium]|nr:HD domain-containing protein [Nitrospirota bacterium]
MPKNLHEVRDPIHMFVRYDSAERQVIDSRFFQRLRHVHQLAMSYLLYPGATHRRFEHSLGVMELASRIFDVITNRDALHPQITDIFPQLSSPDQLSYWRRVLRMAALCHDIGHLPFSHAAEKELLPSGHSHELIGADIVRSPEMKALWEKITPPLRADDVAKIAVGPEKLPGETFSDWENILSEIITGDALGVDRMDYLLRDSLHAGVAYGRFDHFRLIDTIRILPVNTGDHSISPQLGVEEGGLHSTEALLLARYFMFTQVYLHPVRRIYDVHLKDFLKEWLPYGQFPIDIDLHCKYTDNEVTAGLLKSALDSSEPGHTHAKRIVSRNHYKKIYERNPDDIQINPDAGQVLYKALCLEFGADNLRFDIYSKSGGSPDFPIKRDDESISPAYTLSDTLQKLPVLSINYIFIDSTVRDKAKKWLKDNKETVLENIQQEE